MAWAMGGSDCGDHRHRGHHRRLDLLMPYDITEGDSEGPED
jgi:hypothetical protein